MKPSLFSRSVFLNLFACAIISASGLSAAADEPNRRPAAGDAAADFSLADVHGKQVRLSQLLAEGPVALVVLRGYPGYHCPLCTRQAGELLSHAEEFSQAGAKVVMIYPGAEKNLDQHAKEFIAGKKFPAHFRFLVDPGYKFTEAYRLRWDAPGETAYPSSFVIAHSGKIVFAEVSSSHGGRVAAAQLLEALRSK